MNETEHTITEFHMAMKTAMDASRDAIAALTKIGSHEVECARRYGEMTVSVSRFHSRLDELLSNQEKGRLEEMRQKEEARKEEATRRDQRDRDTRQTVNAARTAVGCSVLTGIVAVVLHFLR